MMKYLHHNNKFVHIFYLQYYCIICCYCFQYPFLLFFDDFLKISLIILNMLNFANDFISFFLFSLLTTINNYIYNHTRRVTV